MFYGYQDLLQSRVHFFNLLGDKYNKQFIFVVKSSRIKITYKMCVNRIQRLKFVLLMYNKEIRQIVILTDYYVISG